jgi:hypothetical protein
MIMTSRNSMQKDWKISLKNTSALPISSPAGNGFLFSACSIPCSSSRDIAAQTPNSITAHDPIRTPPSEHQQDQSGRYYNNYAIHLTYRSRQGGLPLEKAHDEPKPPLPRD